MKSLENNNQDLLQLLVSVRRVTKVTKGGKNFSFSVLVIVGDEKSRVGCGIGKHAEIAEARVKAINAAKKSMIIAPLNKGRTLYHDVKVKYRSSKVLLRLAKYGTGIVAGGPIKAPVVVAGYKDVVAKSLGSNNPHNLVYAVFKAFGEMYSLRQVANKRGKKISEVIRKKG